jgi:DNA-binding MarR family transcriptional regulator
VAKNPADQLLADQLFNVLSAVMIGMLKCEGRDLTMRGLSILLVTKTRPGEHNIRSMATLLNVPMGTISQTVDRLEELGLVTRNADPAGGRSVLLTATKAGAAYVTKIGRLAGSAKV